MEERIIRSRRPIRTGHSGNYSPHGSPNVTRRTDRHMSPNLSGSDDDESIEHMGIDNYADTTASTPSTINSSPDVADGESIKYKYSQKNIKFYPDGKVQEVNETKIQKKNHSS